MKKILLMKKWNKLLKYITNNQRRRETLCMLLLRHFNGSLPSFTVLKPFNLSLDSLNQSLCKKWLHSFKMKMEILGMGWNYSYLWLGAKWQIVSLVIKCASETVILVIELTDQWTQLFIINNLSYHQLQVRTFRMVK